MQDVPVKQSVNIHDVSEPVKVVWIGYEEICNCSCDFSLNRISRFEAHTLFYFAVSIRESGRLFCDVIFAIPRRHVFCRDVIEGVIGAGAVCCC
eukprot:XP_001709721.1 Hypothetical protein GL50803_36936 [Giardia lamblia ATCC 50803]